MKIKKIYEAGNPILRKPAKGIENIGAPLIQELIDDMIATLADQGGVGLAAPQVGESLKLMIIAPNALTKNKPFTDEDYIVCINPKITKLYGKTLKDWEGCLSLPGIRGPVNRHEKLNLEFFDRKGVHLSLKATDFLARIIQHEYDHFNGILYIDHIKNNREIISDSEYIKLMNADD